MVSSVLSHERIFACRVVTRTGSFLLRGALSEFAFLLCSMVKVPGPSLKLDINL